MERKIDQLWRHMRASDYRSALALAATFQDLGEYDVAMGRAEQAWWHSLLSIQLRPYTGDPMSRPAGTRPRARSRDRPAARSRARWSPQEGADTPSFRPLFRREFKLQRCASL